MRLTHLFLVPAVAAALLACGCNRSNDEIKTYTVPKETAAPAQSPVQAAAMPPPADASAMPPADIPVSSAHATWTTPSTWQELAPTSIRIGNFAIPGKDGASAEVAIFSFPGSVGTELDNVNRWRNELKLPPLDSDKIVSEPVTIDSLEGKLYKISGASKSIVAANLPRTSDTWVFKMRGDKDVVAAAEPAFRDFLKSVHFTPGGSQAPTAAVLNSAAANPHGDLSGAPPAPVESSVGEPKWITPANWTEKSPGPMILKSYAAMDDAGKTANVTISTFPGDVGGTLLNVNRWRRQMSLPPIEEDKLAEVTQPLETAGGKATLVDFTGTDGKTGQPARLVAVAVPHGDSTWFYKLMGDGVVVGEQKESFVKFVQTVHYP